MIPLSVTETSNLTKPREDATQTRLIFIGICKRSIKYFALLFLLYLDCNCTSVFLNYLSLSFKVNESKRPKALNLMSVLSGFRLHDLVLFFSVSVPKVNESNAQKLEP